MFEAHELEIDFISCVIFWYYSVILFPRLSLSMKFLKDNIILAAVIGAAGAIIGAVAAALITKSPSPPEPIPQTSIPPSLAQGEW
jgi:hypothetical protein